jgi:hypothetical protein
MPSPRKLLLPLACVCWVALSKPAQEQNQEARPELGVFADGDLNKSLDLGNSEDLGEASLLDYATMLGVGRSCGDPSLSGATTTLPVACRIDAPRTQLPTGVAPISWTGLQLLRFHPTVALIPVKGVHHEGCIQAVSQLSFITALQPGLNHSGGDAEVVGVELGEHGPGGVDQAPLAGHGDHRRCPPTLMPNAAATARPPRSAICQES